MAVAEVPPDQDAAPEFDYGEKADDDLETKLLKEKIRAAIKECEYKKKRISDGRAQVFVFIDAQQRLIDAQLDFHKEPEVIISLLEKHVEFARKIEDDRKLRYENGIGPPDEYSQATYYRADAELRLLRAQRKNQLGVERDKK